MRTYSDEELRVWGCNEHGFSQKLGVYVWNTAAYCVSEDFRQCYVWTPDQYKQLADSSCVLKYEALQHYDLSKCISFYKFKHDLIIRDRYRWVCNATVYDHGFTQKSFVLMYQMVPEALAYFINEKETEHQLIVEWRLRNAVRTP
jgi:hypothetical protein